MVKGRYVKTDGWCAKRLVSPKKFAKGSFRTVQSRPGVLVTTGCPKGYWNRKTKRCRVGTRAQRLLVKQVGGKCPPKRHGHYRR